MFKCTECDEEFQSVYSLAGHKKTHTKVVDGVYVNRAARIYPKFSCLICGVEKEYDPAQQAGKYCSAKCSGLGTKARTREKVLEGKAGSKALKDFIIEERGYACEECNVSDWQGKPLVLHLDHIDGNSDNNHPSNGRLLCPNCHSQTDTFTGRNKKNAKRNQYLQRYKSEKKQKGVGSP